jgi:Tol biopolymer transport system component
MHAWPLDVLLRCDRPPPPLEVGDRMEERLSDRGRDQRGPDDHRDQERELCPVDDPSVESKQRREVPKVAASSRSARVPVAVRLGAAQNPCNAAGRDWEPSMGLPEVRATVCAVIETRSKHQHLRPARLASLGLLIVGTLMALVPHDARATFPGPNGRIAFEGSRHGPPDIYVMKADGSQKRNLTQSPGGDFSPAFSADGRKIVFEHSRPHHHKSGIYVMNADGSHRRRLTRGPGIDFQPSFSPSGRKIAFASTRNGKPQIYVMNADGSHQRPLTRHPGRDISPTFSPDGRRIAFTSSLDRNAQIYKMHADGSHQRRLTHNARKNSEPDFSPSGGKIVFNGGFGGHASSTHIYVMRAGGAHQRRLTHDSTLTLNFFPDFSPSGKSVVFVHLLGTSREGLYKMSADGNHRIRLAGPRLEPSAPDWGVRP